jgi:nucleotide-binding universal stress UspA family protein
VFLITAFAYPLGQILEMKEADMAIIEASSPVCLKSIIYLTDFSEPSRSALPFAMTVARNHGSCIHALHVLGSNRHDCANPELKAALAAADDEIAQTEMDKLGSALSAIKHHTIVVRGGDIWSAVEGAIKDHDVNLLVLGTRGRIGLLRHRLGSVAEEIFRRSPVPVLTVGPKVYGYPHNDAHFRRVLFATDFEAESDAAVPVAVSIARENSARLILLHVLDGPWGGVGSIVEPSVAEIMHELYEMVPKGADLWCRSEAIVKYGDPSKQIVETARGRCADLIVLGVRDHASTLDMATHMDKATAHKVLVDAPCPVLTVRGLRSRAHAYAN